jgi:hypothetical protein
MMATTYSSLGGWASLVSKSLKAGRLAPCLLAVSETRHQVVAIHDLRDSKYPRYNEALQSNDCQSSGLKAFQYLFSPNSNSRPLSAFTRHLRCEWPKHSAA